MSERGRREGDDVGVGGGRVSNRYVQHTWGRGPSRFLSDFQVLGETRMVLSDLAVLV